MDYNRLKEICDQVAEDVKNDAANFDGKPFNGKTVAEYLGYHGAAIAALANVLKTMIEHTENLSNEKVPEGSGEAL